MVKNVGVPGIVVPAKECTDPHCPFHGGLKVRGRIIQGEVVSLKMDKTLVIKRNYNYYVKKYQRYERRNAKQAAHIPDCMEVEVGDVVKIMECRPISKTVAFVLLQVVKKANE